MRRIEQIGALLLQRGWRLGTAESCTGGLVAHWITSIPGCSAWYHGGVVAYANATKTALLGVPATMLAQHGAVSEPVARAMAEGVCRHIPAVNIGVSVTGVAGPDGGTADKPVGLVYIGVATAAGRSRVDRLVLSGSRKEIQITAGKAVLEVLYHTASIQDNT